MDTYPTLDNPVPNTYAGPIVVDRYGYILHDGKNSSRVFLCENNQMTLLGELGGEIQADYIYTNLLQRNAKAAKALWNPFKHQGAFSGAIT